MREKWAPRVASAEAGLADRATTEAISMQSKIAEVIGSQPGVLPRLATFDAGTLAKRAAEFQKTLTVGSRVPNDFRWLLRLGPLAISIAVTFLLGLAAVFVDNSELWSSAALRVGGLIVGLTAVGLGILLVAGYVLLNQRLSGAEIRGEELE